MALTVPASKRGTISEEICTYIPCLKGQLHEIWDFIMDIHTKSIVSGSTADILNIFMSCRH
jgi:hypothetical protein